MLEVCLVSVAVGLVVFVAHWLKIGRMIAVREIVVVVEAAGTLLGLILPLVPLVLETVGS